MANLEIQVDASAVHNLALDIDRAKRRMIGQLAERGYQLLRAEVPQQTGNLKQGVAPPEVNYQQHTATLTVSARSARGAREAVVIGADGKEKKRVRLKTTERYNYADVVALGNRKVTLTPRSSRAFLIPVSSPPSGESYLISGGQIFVVRRSRKAQKPNPFHERAGKRLEDEAPAIGEAVLRKLFT